MAVMLLFPADLGQVVLASFCGSVERALRLTFGVLT